MKAKIFSKRLVLNKITIADLNANEMNNAHGGTAAFMDEDETGTWTTDCCMSMDTETCTTTA